MNCYKYLPCCLLFVFVLRCLTSRWDQPAQPKQSVDVRQHGSENTAHHVSGSKSLIPEAVKPAPQGGVEMAAAMAAKINAMLMAKGKLLTPPPLLAKVGIFKEKKILFNFVLCMQSFEC